MVKILANGELVSDDDPRVRSSAGQRTPTTGQNPPIPGRNIHGIDQNKVPGQGHGGQGHGGQGQGGQGQGSPMYQHGPSASIFDTMNQRLTAAGFPSWNAGPYRVDPIVSIGFLLSLCLIGVRGLIFSGLLFFIVKYSQSNGPRIPMPDLSWLGFGGLRGNNAAQGGPRTGGQAPRPSNNPPPRRNGNQHFSGAGHVLGR